MTNGIPRIKMDEHLEVAAEEAGEDRVLMPLLLALLMSIAATAVTATAQTPNGRARARDLGVTPGVFPPGRLNAITDVAGVRVGHTTVVEGDSYAPE